MKSLLQRRSWFQVLACCGALALGACEQKVAPLDRTVAEPDARMAGDPVMGQRLFLQCRACHTLKPGEPHSVGPNLGNLIGSQSGTKTAYDYSPAMKALALTWDTNTLDAFLTSPISFVPKNQMAYVGLTDAKQRADLIAYLAEATLAD